MQMYENLRISTNDDIDQGANSGIEDDDDEGESPIIYLAEKDEAKVDVAQLICINRGFSMGKII